LEGLFFILSSLFPHFPTLQKPWPATQIQQIDPVKYSPIEIKFPEMTIEQFTSGRAVMGRPEVEHVRIPTQKVSSLDFQRR